MDKILCVIEESVKYDKVDEEKLWLDLTETPSKYYYTVEQKIIPLYNHPHSDKENGQSEIHYHIDSRYTNEFFYNTRISLPLKNNQRLEYRYLKKLFEKENTYTHVSFIKNSKLKHKCIYKGKCPHRGFNLNSETPDKSGIITCPLHGLKFDTNNNNRIINFDK